MMQSDDGREELWQGSFDLDKTAERILEARRLGCRLVRSCVVVGRGGQLLGQRRLRACHGTLASWQAAGAAPPAPRRPLPLRWAAAWHAPPHRPPAAGAGPGARSQGCHSSDPLLFGACPRLPLCAGRAEGGEHRGCADGLGAGGAREREEPGGQRLPDQLSPAPRGSSRAGGRRPAAAQRRCTLFGKGARPPTCRTNACPHPTHAKHHDTLVQHSAAVVLFCIRLRFVLFPQPPHAERRPCLAVVPRQGPAPAYCSPSGPAWCL